MSSCVRAASPKDLYTFRLPIKPVTFSVWTTHIRDTRFSCAIYLILVGWEEFAMASAYHIVHYKLFNPKPKGTATLEALCRTALNTKGSGGATLWQRVGDRVFDLPEIASRKVVLNKVADLASAVFGEMCLIQSDGLQALLELKPANVQTSNITNAQVFNLQERSAPQNSQFIRGMTYWLTVGNHLLFVKTQSMTAEYMRQYLEWLTKIQSAAFPKSSEFLLQAEFDKSQVGGDIGDIRSLRVSGNSFPMSIQAAAKAPDSQKLSPRIREYARHVMDRYAEFEQAKGIVEALFGPKKAKSLVDSLGPNEYLSVDAAVKVKGRRTEESKERMQELANGLADLTDGKVQVEGKDGKLSDEDAILRTRMPFNLPHEGSNFLDFDNVADQLQEVYARFVKDGKIAA